MYAFSLQEQLYESEAGSATPTGNNNKLFQQCVGNKNYLRVIRCFFINTVYYSKQNLHISSQLQYCTNVTKKLSCGDQERRILSIKHYLLAKTTHFPSSDCVVSIASVLLYIPALVGLVKAQFLQLRAILSNSNGKIIIRPNTVIQTCFHIGA